MPRVSRPPSFHHVRRLVIAVYLVFTGLTVYLVLTEDDPAIQLALLAILIAFLPTIVAVVAFVASRETVPDLLGRLTRIELLLERITEATERERPEPNGGPEG